MGMKISEEGKQFIASHEGFVSRYYLDPVNIPTIGMGFTWRSSSFKQWWKKNKKKPFSRGATITRDEATEVLGILINDEYGAAVNRFLGNRKISQSTFDAMCSVVYNCGAGALNWKWAADIKNGDLHSAAQNLKNTAVTGKSPSGKRIRLEGLVRRRKEEAELILKGNYIYKPAPQKTTSLSFGSRGEDVRQLILQLSKLGYYDGVQDDVYGRETQRAVLEFQKDNGLLADGVVGEKTRQALKSRLDGTAKGGSMPDLQAPQSSAKKTKSKSAPLLIFVGIALFILYLTFGGDPAVILEGIE